MDNIPINQHLRNMSIKLQPLYCFWIAYDANILFGGKDCGM